MLHAIALWTAIGFGAGASSSDRTSVGEMPAFDTRCFPWRAVVVPCIGDGVADAVDRAPSFRAFLEGIARGESILLDG